MYERTYHSGDKLRTLRELKGLKETELADVIGVQLDEILSWEREGIPESAKNKVLEFFEIENTLFLVTVTTDRMLEKVVMNELARHDLDIELDNRIKHYNLNNSKELDLSSLGLLTIPDIVFKLPGLTKLNLSDNLLSEVPNELEKLINSGCEINLRQNFTDPNLGRTYNLPNYSEKKETQRSLLIDSIRFTQLRLENIGIYEDLTINFDDQLTVLIGINGAGKTTILKALSLGILGPRGSTNSKAALLRSIDTPSSKDSRITLNATFGGTEHSNEIILRYESDTGEVRVIGTHFIPLYNNESSLKNLVLSLSEQRNSSNANSKQNLEKQPRILDLLPLLLGDEQSCTQGFISWWANLENSKTVNPNDRRIIDLCFQVFSEFMGENIKSAGLRKVQPKPELWIKYDSGRSTPFDLASQGYQAVMGWVGFIIQRMVEANEDRPLPLSQPSVIIIDEIDQLLSIKWQQKILSILRKFFPHTQWVISTHSPMILTDLDKHQVVQLHEQNDQVIAEYNEVDLWMWQYGDILRRYFEITTTPPKYQEKVLKEQIEQANAKGDVDKLATLEERLKKLRSSIAARDEFEKQLQSLREREKQLLDLMKELKGNN